MNQMDTTTFERNSMPRPNLYSKYTFGTSERHFLTGKFIIRK